MSAPFKVGDRVVTKIDNPAIWTDEAGRILNGQTGTVTEIRGGRDAYGRTVHPVSGRPIPLSYCVTFDVPVERSWSRAFVAFHFDEEDLRHLAPVTP